MLRFLILALLWRGSLSQQPGFTLTVPQLVSVQEGLCVLVPCTFTYPASYDTDNPRAQLYRYWYKDLADVHNDPPVASSDPSRNMSQDTQGRFRLTGDPAPSDCSLQISDARRTDAGRYFLRVEKGDFKYSYRTNNDHTYPMLEISVPGLTEEPEIQISPAQRVPGMLLAGEPVTVTCTAPGRCSGSPPRVTWMGPFSDTARNVSAQLANGTWAHSSELSFTPGLGDNGKELVCTVTYSSAQGPSTSRTIRLHVGYPPGPPNITGTLTRNGRPVLAPLVAEGDIMSLETQEGDSLSLSYPDPLVGNGSQLTAREGDSLRFLCSVASNPRTELGWVRGGRAVEGTRPVVENQLRLELPNVTAEDGGLYGCWAQNNESSAQGTFQLLVEYSPRPGTGLNSSCQRQGPSISCSCSLRSHPPPQLQWQVDGESLAGNGSRGALQVSSWAQGDEAISTLSWTGSVDGGHQIFCLGSNPYGFHILLLSPPEIGGLSWEIIEISCKLIFVATGFFLAYYLTLLYYRWKPFCCRGSRRKDRPGAREYMVPEFGF
ncbi:sialic acid-binding Ig-like lectin 13 [Chrysemys picta bellii]|uniref:sialic acid-binding Ig-like lectin 13 n=1 Tax=Chrysemys picta bellii TaxID=8478 RepID=UPI0032B1BC54